MLLLFASVGVPVPSLLLLQSRRRQVAVCSQYQCWLVKLQGKKFSISRNIRLHFKISKVGIERKEQGVSCLSEIRQHFRLISLTHSTLQITFRIT